MRYRVRSNSLDIKGLKDKIIGQGTYINPKHEDWKEYKRRKRQATLALTAVILLKYKVINKSREEQFAIVRKSFLLANSKQLKAAKRLIRAYSKKLENNPEEYASVTEWCKA